MSKILYNIVMHIISLGHACQVKTFIDRNFHPQKTYFFDWIISNFKSVLYILENINDESIISKEKFTNKWVYMKCDSWADSQKIENIDFPMISIHDFPLYMDYMNYMDQFVLKYKRRLERFKNIIENNDKNVHMIHCIYHSFIRPYILEKNDIDYFFKLINKINPNNKCYLHIVISPKFNFLNETSISKINNKTYIYYLINKYDDVEGDWNNLNFNWEIIANNIKKISL